MAILILSKSQKGDIATDCYDLILLGIMVGTKKRSGAVPEMENSITGFFVLMLSVKMAEKLKEIIR